MDDYIVYVRVDAQGRIIAINSSAFLPDAEGWTEIGHGTGDRYHHAQGNYLPLPLMTDDGIWRFKLVDGLPVARSAEELAADITPPDPTPTIEERVTAVEGEVEQIITGLEALANG